MPASTRPGEWVDPASGLGLGLDDVQSGTFNMTISTDRYTCAASTPSASGEAIWMRTWQVAGRVDELPKVGDWKKYRDLRPVLHHRPRQGRQAARLRQRLPASRQRAVHERHRQRQARIPLPVPPVVLRPRRQTARDCCARTWPARSTRARTRCIQVPVDTFAGFIFLNPDPDAAPLADYLGEEVVEHSRALPPRGDVATVMNVREALDCNWKVVMDAFDEGYHINGIHPQLLQVLTIDPADHAGTGSSTTTASPWLRSRCVGASAGGAGRGDPGAAGDLPRDGRGDPALPGTGQATYRDDGRAVDFPDGVTARTLLQQATRDTLTGMGLDVSGLTDAQMSDNHGWVLFPNFFMTDPGRRMPRHHGACRIPTATRTAASGMSPATCTCRRRSGRVQGRPDRGRRAGQLQVFRGAPTGLRADAAPAAGPAQRRARPPDAGQGGSRHRPLPLGRRPIHV